MAWGSPTSAPSRSRAVMKPLADVELGTSSDFDAELEAERSAELRGQGVGDDDIAVIARAHLRYDGTDTPLRCRSWRSAEQG